MVGTTVSSDRVCTASSVVGLRGPRKEKGKKHSDAARSATEKLSIHSHYLRLEGCNQPNSSITVPSLAHQEAIMTIKDNGKSIAAV